MVKKASGSAVGPTSSTIGVAFPVRATQFGFLGQKRRAGDVFLVTAAQFSAFWMVRVDASTPLETISPAQARRKEHAAIIEGGSERRLKKNAADLEDDDDDGTPSTPTGDANPLG